MEVLRHPACLQSMYAITFSDWSCCEFGHNGGTEPQRATTWVLVNVFNIKLIYEHDDTIAADTLRY